MRLTLSVLFMGILLAIPGVMLADAAFEREARDQTAARALGTAFAWPDDPLAADPGTALRILAEAAEATGANVLRTSVLTGESGRKRITHYLYPGRDRTALFDGFTLAQGRWPTGQEMRTGAAAASSGRPLGEGNVGVPEVFADRYGLGFAPLAEAYESLPAAGRYVLETADGAAADRFLAIVRERLVEAGLPEAAVQDLRPPEAADSAQPPRGLETLAYLLTGAAVVVVAFVLLREGKRIGVLRLMGHSPVRIWYFAVGRLQLAAFLAGLACCAAVALAVPGVDGWFLRAFAVAWAGAAAAGFAATLAAGLIIVARVDVSDLIKGSLQ